MLLDIERTTAPMPVLDFFIEGERDVLDTQELEAVGVGLAYQAGEIREGASCFIYGVGPKDGEKNELYAVKIKGAPHDAVNEAFVSAAKRLLSYNDDEPYPLEDKLDYAPVAMPPRPAVVNALTAAVTKNNGSGKNLPHIVPR